MSEKKEIPECEELIILIRRKATSEPRALFPSLDDLRIIPSKRWTMRCELLPGEELSLRVSWKLEDVEEISVLPTADVMGEILKALIDWAEYPSMWPGQAFTKVEQELVDAYWKYRRWRTATVGPWPGTSGTASSSSEHPISHSVPPETSPMPPASPKSFLLLESTKPSSLTESPAASSAASDSSEGFEDPDAG